MIKVGITGGIGSGKSMVCKILAHMGVKVYYADISARILINCDLNVRAKLIAAFGNDIYHENILNKSKLADLIFTNQNARQKINSIVHPAVAADFEIWSQSHKTQKYVVEEAALLFESGNYRNMDAIVTVFTPLELRIERLKMRDGSSLQRINEQMASQMPDDEKLKRSQYVIYNDEKRSLIEQIIDLEQKLRINSL